MPRTAAPVRQTLAVTALIAALVLLIVVGPFVLVRITQRESQAAAEMVNHGHEVETAVQSLMYDLRNRESALVAYAFGHDSTAIRERLAESRREIPQNLERLRTLTLDNPAQQLRIGRLAAIIEQRGQIGETILAKPAGSADARDIEWLLDRNPLRFIGTEISDTEQALLARRVAAAAAAERAAPARCPWP